MDGTLTRNSGYPRRSGYVREDKDYYVEPRWVVHLLLDVERFDGAVLDPCCGGGTIPSVCLSRGIPARGSDVIDRGFGEVRDLFSLTEPVDNIISNVPYRIAEECARHMIGLARYKTALILPMTFWESRTREVFFRQYPPIRWFPCSDRPSMPPGTMDGPRDRYGALIQPLNSGGTMPFAWFIWQRGYKGATSAMRLPLVDEATRKGLPSRQPALPFDTVVAAEARVGICVASPPQLDCPLPLPGTRAASVPYPAVPMPAQRGLPDRRQWEKR